MARAVVAAVAEVPDADATIQSFHTTLLHHGMIIVGVPYAEPRLLEMKEISGGTPYGATTLSNTDGNRQPSENELAIARFQGRHVAEVASKLLVHDGLPGKSTSTDEYPTEQQGISNFQVNVNVNGKANVSGPTPSDALDNAAGDSVYVNVSGKDIKPFPFAVSVNLDIGYSLLFCWIFAVFALPH
jgi:hypothetical protein